MPTEDRWLPLRYVINGVAAAVLHFAALYSNLHFLHIPSAGLANLLAAVVGISASFVGSRHFVYRASAGPLGRQAAAFGVLYAALAAAHGLILFAWTDLAGLDYRVGFLLATAFQVAVSYVGNRTLVFKA